MAWRCSYAMRKECYEYVGMLWQQEQAEAERERERGRGEETSAISLFLFLALPCRPLTL